MISTNRKVINCQCKSGFTLAETLITLGIIGVVAVLVMSKLIVNHQKTVTVNRLKSEYSKFSSLINRSVGDNGNIADWIDEFNNISNLSEKSKLLTEKYIIPYIDGGGKTFKQYEYGTVWSLGRKEGIFGYYVSGKPYRIKNGTVFNISIYHDRLYLLLDIDNKIKDNIVGKDVFLFVVSPKKNRLEAAGNGLSREVLTGKNKGRWCFPPECEATEWLSGAESCNKNNTDRYSGSYCSALIMQDGWQIKDDYPW